MPIWSLTLRRTAGWSQEQGYGSGLTGPDEGWSEERDGDGRWLAGAQLLPGLKSWIPSAAPRRVTDDDGDDGWRFGRRPAVSGTTRRLGLRAGLHLVPLLPVTQVER